jgi:hypothetical protein
VSRRLVCIVPPSDPVYGDDYIERVLHALQAEFPEFEFVVDRDTDATLDSYTIQITRGAAKATKREQRRFFELGAFLHENCKLSGPAIDGIWGYHSLLHSAATSKIAHVRGARKKSLAKSEGPAGMGTGTTDAGGELAKQGGLQRIRTLGAAGRVLGGRLRAMPPIRTLLARSGKSVSTMV